jgi:glyoxylase-like metal-dependent hydrolase (beta-lactamase superfamily II)
MSEAPAKMSAPAAGVKVRMYRQGLGDCFLLAFPTRGPRPCYVLIDCGVLLSPLLGAAAETKRKVVASLSEATGGKIDVLVASLEPWDHVSGCQAAKEMFDRIEIGQIWAAWAEVPNDPAPVPGEGNPPHYWRPGDRPELPGVDSARSYVLGPPGDASSPRPSALPAAADGSAHEPGEEELKALSFPFAAAYRVPPDAARQDPFFQASYFGVAGQPSEHEMAWRQIETEWLTSESHSSLQRDRDITTTSLALAIELLPSGKVLLFAAEPQESRWLSSHSLPGPGEGEPGGPATPVTVVDLLHHFEKRCTVTPDYVELTVGEPVGRRRKKKE